MTEQANSSRGSGSIAGTALATLGTFLLYEDLAGLLARLTDLIGSRRSAAPGTLPAILLSASMLDRHRFLAVLLHCLLISCWPLLLVVAGTVWSRTPSPSTAKKF